MEEFIGQGVFVIAEIGINHNGDINIAKQLIKAAKEAGCNAVKFQKRTIEDVYTPAELSVERESPFGKTNGDLKRGLEFGYDEYCEIDKFCKAEGIMWFATPWDVKSVDFLNQFDIPIFKVASAGLTDDEMLMRIKQTGKPVIMSVGMSTQAEVDHAVSLLDKDKLMLMQCTCMYPAPSDRINLRAMTTLMQRYGVQVGYSGHEKDTLISSAAVAMGARAIERHFTLDVGMWGSDHKASIEPSAMKELVQNIRTIESALGSPEILCLDEELPVKAKLRRV